MNCPECGAEIMEGQRVCNRCDAPIPPATRSATGSKSDVLPGYFWVFPILLGIVGGIILAAVAAALFKRGWLAYLVVGAIITFIEIVVWGIYSFSHGV